MSTVSAEPATQDVVIGRERLEGRLVRPGKAQGLVIFAHGSGSSRFSPRNVEVARQLQTQGLATLLFDLLTEDEAYNRRNVFDIAMLGGRMVEAVRFARSDPELSRLPIGLFGASTGAAAALVAAAELPEEVSAVVSRGGRPDMADDALPHVRAPTLLIVGGKDTTVIGLNRCAFDALTCEKRLDIVPGATHLFEEPGALDKVVELAGHWFSSRFEPVAT